MCVIAKSNRLERVKLLLNFFSKIIVHVHTLNFNFGLQIDINNLPKLS